MLAASEVQSAIDDISRSAANASQVSGEAVGAADGADLVISGSARARRRSRRSRR
ncbi:MAG: hypothetical protein R2705_20785 [Ilumatobacteraceae bacterium]